VIRELVMMLDLYGCDEIYGIVGGYKGVMQPDKWQKLTPRSVEEMHLKGGSFLVSDRGNPPHVEMAKMYREKGITHVYVIGGDGTHKGIMQTYEQMLNIGYKASLCGIPKTIDNDIALLDFTFGFHTAVKKAVEAIDSAYTEATCNANCMGLVKLMGRHAGFIAMHSTVAARHVDLCLIPEMDICMDSVKQHIAETMARKGYCVVVIAEGLGDTLIKADGAADAGGNKTLADVGPWFKKQIESHMKKLKRQFTCKYIDPSYIIRSTPPDNFDSIYCSILAQQAVHGCFAGYTGFSVGKISNHYVMLPIDEITSRKSRTVHLGGHWFTRMVYTTRQSCMKKKDIEDGFTKEMDMIWELFKRKDTEGSGNLDRNTVNTILIDLGMSVETANKVLNTPKFTTKDGNVNCKSLVHWIFQGVC
jgi:6-phosphofructokinase 1